MREDRRILRRMILIMIWTIFISATLSGMIVAYNQTRHMAEGEDAVTIVFFDSQ